MKVLIADKLSARAVERLEAAGHDVQVRADLTADELSAEIGCAEVLVVRSTRVTRPVFENATDLSLVIRAGAGVNTIDVEAASERGVYVANCPGQNTAAVAELTLGFLVAADRRIVDATVALREGKWRKKEFGQAEGLKGRTLGILGMGAIGRRVAQLGHALEMPVVAWSRSLSPEVAQQLGVGYCETPLKVAQCADIVSIHVAASPDTKSMVDARFLEALRPGATLINTSRGDVVDQQALTQAIASKGLKVALDVFDNEPGGGEAPFPQTELAAAIVGTPHIGASTEQASEAIAAEVVRIVDQFVRWGRPPNTVNMEQRSSATHHLVVRHLNRVGVLATVLNELRSEGVNIEEMDNVIFQGGAAACCTLSLDGPPTELLVQKLRNQEHVLSAQLSLTKT